MLKKKSNSRISREIHRVIFCMRCRLKGISQKSGCPLPSCHLLSLSWSSFSSFRRWYSYMAMRLFTRAFHIHLSIFIFCLDPHPFRFSNFATVPRPFSFFLSKLPSWQKPFASMRPRQQSSQSQARGEDLQACNISSLWHPLQASLSLKSSIISPPPPSISLCARLRSVSLTFLILCARLHPFKWQFPKLRPPAVEQ